MPYIFPLAAGLGQAQWKVKIHDIERLEPPHITIYKKWKKWRFSLRDKEFLDNGDRWSQIDKAVKSEIENEANWKLLQEKWNEMHPNNPV